MGHTAELMYSRAHSGADQHQDNVHVPGALVGKQGADFALGEHLPLAALVSVNVQQPGIVLADQVVLHGPGGAFGNHLKHLRAQGFAVPLVRQVVEDRLIVPGPQLSHFLAADAPGQVPAVRAVQRDLLILPQRLEFGTLAHQRPDLAEGVVVHAAGGLHVFGRDGGLSLPQGCIIAQLDKTTVLVHSGPPGFGPAVHLVHGAGAV